MIIIGCHGSTRLPGAGVVTKKSGALFGPTESKESDTKHFLHKAAQSLKEESQSKDPFRYTDKNRGPVPKPEDRPVLGIKSNKNYVTANAVEAILMGIKHLFLSNLITLFCTISSPSY